ncbi:uridine kinase [Streptomyces sp. NPDC058157]|uniref:uridine kinase family protein n=1 Tax=Streptomyces sp. NPDC058157 TaxID=3346360 RepID=UPI0036E17524
MTTNRGTAHVNQHPTPRILLIGGGAGSGKTALARALADVLPGAAVLHLDSCFHTDPTLAPSVPRLNGTGRVVDFSNPRSLDPDRIESALAGHAEAPLVILEGVFALALPELTARATWTVFVDTPADVRIVRKTLRKIREGQDPVPGLLGYDNSRRSYLRHVAPTRGHARLVLDGTRDPADRAAQLREVVTDDAPPNLDTEIHKYFI